jgi:predicted lipoprotein with Yx(FWY)xxD motif
MGKQASARDVLGDWVPARRRSLEAELEPPRAAGDLDSRPVSSGVRGSGLRAGAGAAVSTLATIRTKGGYSEAPPPKERDMKRRQWFATAAVLTLGALAANAAVQGVAASPSRTVVKTSFNRTLKKTILVDASGRTLYMFTSDTSGKDTVCTPTGPYGAECPTIWPPLTSPAAPRAGVGVRQSLLGVYRRSDGKRQVTYNHHPLYYFHGDSNTPAGDKKPGDAHGQGLFSQWYVLAPTGTPIRK